MNHTTEECYSKHGFPPWFKKKNEHSANNCFSNNDQELKDCKDNEGTHSSNETQSISFTKEQIEQIRKVMQESRINNVVSTNAIVHETGKHNAWILDIGATDHVTCSLNCFTSYHKIKPIIVHLPNGSQVITFLSGTVHISEILF